MSIEQLDVIDFISTTPEGKAVVTIADHLSWDEDAHLQLLQDKINRYLQFIESGQIYEDYPEASNREIGIMVITKYEPNKIAVDFLERCKEVIQNADIGFEWQTVSNNERNIAV